jgi:hypothetical protein
MLDQRFQARPVHLAAMFITLGQCVLYTYSGDYNIYEHCEFLLDTTRNLKVKYIVENLTNF